MQTPEQNTSPEDLIKAIELVDEISEQINAKEQECLNSIYTRFCLKYAKIVDFRQVRRKTYPHRPNYWEYWYKYGTNEGYMLMSRELVIEDNEPKLNISFSKELTHNNEL